MRLDFHQLTVSAMQPDTAEAVVLNFEVPEALASVFAFTQGQYLTLRAKVQGQDLRRAYSICAGVDDGALRVAVRRVKGGVFSNWLNSELRVGDSLQVMPPQGRFFVPLAPAQRRHHVGLAGGSGITPILSIMKTLLAREPHSRFTLIYGNRQLRSTMFKADIEDLKNRYMSRLSVHHVFSDEQTDADLNMGLLDRHKVAQFLSSVLGPASIDHAYICGPFQMNDEAQAALLASGVPEQSIHIERFGVAAQATGVATADLPQMLPGDPQTSRVLIIRDGLRRELEFHRSQPSLLACGAAAGLELPFACTSGVCGTCRAKVLQGQVRMSRNFALDQAELAAGFVLTCQAHPVSERLVLSFDER